MKRPLYIIPACVLILACLGVAYAWGVFIIPLTKEFGWGRGEVSLAVSILLFIFPVSMIIAGILEKKFGPRFTVTLGGIFVSAGWLLANRTESLLWLYLSYGLLVGIGTGFGYMPALSTGLRWFPDKKGLIAGVIVFGFGFGAAFLAPLASKLISIYGWRTTMIIYGSIFGAVITVCAQVLKTPLSIQPDNKTLSLKRTPFLQNDFDLKQMVGTLSFKIMFVSYLVAMFSGMMVIGHIKAFGHDLGFQLMSSAFALSILSIANGIGRILFGWLSDKLGRLNVLYSILFAVGLCMIILPHMSDLKTIYVFSFCIGLCFGGFLSVYPAMTSDFFGLKNFGINYGIVSLGYGSGCFIGPWFGGYIYDLTGSYNHAFTFAGILTLLTALITTLFLRPPKIRI